MIIIKEVLTKWLQDNLVISGFDPVTVNDGWFDIRRKEQPQICVRQLLESNETDNELDYPNGGFSFAEFWDIHMFASNFQMRERMFVAMLKALRTISTSDLPYADDEDSVMHHFFLDNSPRRLNPESKTQYPGSTDELDYQWENYRVVFTVKSFLHYK